MENRESRSDQGVQNRSFISPKRPRPVSKLMGFQRVFYGREWGGCGVGGGGGGSDKS